MPPSWMVFAAKGEGEAVDRLRRRVDGAGCGMCGISLKSRRLLFVLYCAPAPLLLLLPLPLPLRPVEREGLRAVGS